MQRRRCDDREAARWSLLFLAVLVAAASAEHGPESLQAQQPPQKQLGWSASIARALCRIRDSTGDRQLMEDVWLEKLPDGGLPAAESPPAPDDLAALADSVFDKYRLSWHNALLNGIDFAVQKDPRTRRYAFSVIRQDENATAGNPGTRTFGLQRRRLQLILFPIVYKLGVITTLLTGLTVLSVKGVTIGVILLMLAITSIVAKMSGHYHPTYVSSSWSGHDPYDRSSSHHLPQDKNIHVHVHTAPGSGPGSGPGSPYAMSKSSPAYDTTAQANRYNEPYWNQANDEYSYETINQYNNNNSRKQNNRDGDHAASSAFGLG